MAPAPEGLYSTAPQKNYLQVRLTATDSLGLARTVSRKLEPKAVKERQAIAARRAIPREICPLQTPTAFWCSLTGKQKSVATWLIRTLEVHIEISCKVEACSAA